VPEKFVEIDDLVDSAKMYALVAADTNRLAERNESRRMP